MRFDRFSIALLTLRPDAPRLDEAAAAALQDAHMAYNADLHDAGHLLASGPLADERYRGLGIWRLEPERVRVLREQDPAVRAGRLAAEVVRWMVPAGNLAFPPARFPRSVAEVASGEVALDGFTVVLLSLRPDAPLMDEAARVALQDGHLAHNGRMRDAGRMLAAGPLDHEELRGLHVWRPEPEEVRGWAGEDPSVRAGRLEPRVMRWQVPAGAVSFVAVRFPRSTAEVDE